MKALNDYNYYIFDFDGTLVDTTEGIYKSVQYALNSFGITENDEARLGYFIGPPLFHSFKTLYDVSDDDANALINKYRERYKLRASEESSLYPGIKELLSELKGQNKTVAIASSKPRLFVDEISKHHGIDEFFDYTAAESFGNNHSSKKDLILSVLSHFNNPDKETALMIGDRFYDIDGAKEAGVKSAGAVYGFGNAPELEKAGADYLLFSPKDLLK